ncbi:Uncharacterized protein HZ326_3073 [Fusarium oxysporum f. sp. albedinis]|nr:Uncharacterized protein HZ326_3073 [Fusarium oxysporum f. sp. albedinis]
MSKPHHLPALLRGTSLLLNPLYPPHGFELPFPFSPSSRQYQPVSHTHSLLGRADHITTTIVSAPIFRCCFHLVIPTVINPNIKYNFTFIT